MKANVMSEEYSVTRSGLQYGLPKRRRIQSPEDKGRWQLIGGKDKSIEESPISIMSEEYPATRPESGLRYSPPKRRRIQSPEDTGQWKAGGKLNQGPTVMSLAS